MQELKFVMVEELNNENIEILSNIYSSTKEYFKLAGEPIDNFRDVVKEDFYSCPNKDRSKKIYGYIIFEDNNIGVLDLILDFPMKDTCYIGLLIISEKFQRQGIGEKIYNYIEDKLKERNFKYIQLGVLENNFIGYNFWNKMGFNLKKTVKSEIKPNKNWIVNVMNKRIGEI